MWRPDPTRLVKVRLHTAGDGGESVWAEDNGAAPAPPGAPFVRIAGIPFIHAKPTYGDVVVVVPEPGRVMLAWDGEGWGTETVGARLIEDAGRWALVLAFTPASAEVDSEAALGELLRACEAADIASELCCAPLGADPGQLYLAVPGELALEEVLAFLGGQAVPLTLALVHPRPEEDADTDADAAG